MDPGELLMTAYHDNEFQPVADRRELAARPQAKVYASPRKRNCGAHALKRQP
jgi:hypothetical protein